MAPDVKQAVADGNAAVGRLHLALTDTYAEIDRVKESIARSEGFLASQRDHLDGLERDVGDTLLVLHALGVL